MTRSIVLIVLLFASPAAADLATYAVQHTHDSKRPLWRDDAPIEIAIDSSFPDAARPVIEDAATAWEDATDACGGPRFAVTRSASTAGTLHLRGAGDRWDGDPAAAAVTHLQFIDDGSADDDGKIFGADIELNGVAFEFLLPGASPVTAKPALDLQAVVTHELGHALGLDHDCASGGQTPTDERGQQVPACDAADLPVAIRTATMFIAIEPGEVGARTPEATDVEGVCAVMNGGGDGDITGGCSTTGGGSSLVVLCFLITRRRPVHWILG